MSSVSGVSPYSSSLWLEVPTEPASGPRPDGTSGAFATGLPPIGPSSDDASLQLVLSILRSDGADKAAANRIRSLLSGFAGVFGAIGANALQRQRLIEQNADNAAEIANLQQQKTSATSDLASAEDKLQHDQKLDPPDPDLVKADMDAIAAIQASISALTLAIGNLQTQSDANTAKIAGLQSGFLSGFASIAAAIIRNLASQQRSIDAGNDSSIGLIESIYADVQQFLTEAQAVKEQRLLQGRAADDKDIATQQTDDLTRRNADAAVALRGEVAGDNQERDQDAGARNARQDVIAQAERQALETARPDPALATEQAGSFPTSNDPSAASDDARRAEAEAIAASAVRRATDSTVDSRDDDPVRAGRRLDRSSALAPEEPRNSASPVGVRDEATSSAARDDAAAVVRRHDLTANANAAAVADHVADLSEIADRALQRDAVDQAAIDRLVERADRLVATLSHLLNPPSPADLSERGLTSASLQDGTGRLRIPI